MQGPHFLWGKRIELLTELLGRPPRRLAWIGNPGNTGSEANWGDARDAGTQIGSDVLRVNVSKASDLDRAFDTLKGRDALLVQFDFLLAVEKRRVAALVARQRLPAIYENRSQALAGGLMSYGGDLRENYRQGAQYVHRVLNGTPPGDLPVVQASRFELVLNVKTARALDRDVTTEDRGPARVVVVGAICGWLRADTIVWLGYSFPLVLRRLTARTVPVLFAQPGLAPE